MDIARCARIRRRLRELTGELPVGYVSPLGDAPALVEVSAAAFRRLLEAGHVPDRDEDGVPYVAVAVDRETVDVRCPALREVARAS